MKGCEVCNFVLVMRVFSYISSENFERTGGGKGSEAIVFGLSGISSPINKVWRVRSCVQNPYGCLSYLYRSKKGVAPINSCPNNMDVITSLQKVVEFFLVTCLNWSKQASMWLTSNFQWRKLLALVSNHVC